MFDTGSALAMLTLLISLLFFVGASVSQAAFLLLGQIGGLPWPEGEIPARPIRKVVSRFGRIAILLTLLKTASGLAAGVSLGTWAMKETEGTWGLLALLALAALLVLVVVDSVAQAVGRRYHRGILLVAAPILVGVGWLLGPLLWALERPGSLNGRRQTAAAYDPGGRPEADWENMPSPPEQADFMEADVHERRMIRAILTLEDVAAREIMVPRVDIVAVEADTPLTEVVAHMAAGGHSMIPVYRGTIDHVVGIGHARDVLQSITSPGGQASLVDIARPALFIPDSMPLDQLLREFQERHVSIAVVVDEYGGTEGLVTVEDLLEEIVGEIEDEFASKEPAIVRVSEEEAVVDGRVTVEEVNELFQTHLESDGFDTVAGLLSAHLGKIPAAGDSLEMEGLTLRVVTTSGRRVRKVRVIRSTTP